MNTIQFKREFMQAGGQPVRETPAAPTIEERKLTLALILEELYELAEAYGMEGTFQKMLESKVPETMCRYDAATDTYYDYHEDTHEYDAVATLDALVDLRVVCDGPVLSSGLQGVWEAANAEVFRSNMSKFFVDARPALLYAAAVGGSAHENNGFWCVKNAAGKVQKPAHYSPPDLAAVLAAATFPQP